MTMKQARRCTGIRRRDFLKASLAGAAAALTGGYVSPVTAQPPKTLRFAHMLPTTQTQSRAVAMFGDELAKLSGNKFKLEIFPSSQLGSIAEMMQSVQAGPLVVRQR